MGRNQNVPSLNIAAELFDIQALVVIDVRALANSHRGGQLSANR
jgi:hypothetical protein